MARNKKKIKKDEKSLKEELDTNSNSETLTAEEVSKKYTVAELKKILKENGMTVSGKKQDLVERVLPILNADSSETSSEDIPNDLDSPVDEDSLTSALSIFGINYEDLTIKDKSVKGDNTNLIIQSFTQNGLNMSDSTISIDSSDSSNVDLKMNIPEISYSNFKDTIFTFKNLDLSILPSSDPQNLEFSAIMDGLEIITESNYVNLKGLDLSFKTFSDEKGVRLTIDIDRFIYPSFNETSIDFENLGIDISIGLDGQSLAISVNLPKLTLLNKDYRVNLSDLILNILLPDLNLSNLDLSIEIPDFHYTNFDDVHVDMDNVVVSLDSISKLNTANVIIRMDGLDAGGLDSFDELFPMLNITEINFKNNSSEPESHITMTTAMPLLDISKMSLSALIPLLTSGFDLDTYISNMPGLYKDSLDDTVDISSTEVSDSESPGFDIVSVFENCDYSGLNAIRLNVTGLLDSIGIDLSDLDIDLSGYDLSDISMSELIEALTNSEFIKTALKAIGKISTIDFEKLDLSGLIVSFDTKNFDITSLLESLNLDNLDLSAIADILNNSDMDLGSIFENFDFSCLGAIKLNLTGLIDSIGIDLSDLGIDLSGYDLSDISLSELMDILTNLDIDMSTITALLKLFDLELDDLNFEGLISSFDAENFDMSSLLESLNISGSDIAKMIDMFTTSDIDFDSIFKNCDYSSLDGMVLDLSGLIDSAGIDVSDLGIDMSDYDLSAISVPELIGILSNPDLDMTAITSKLKSSSPELDNLDMSGLISSFDAENFDISSLLESLNLGDLDISAIGDMLSNSDIDLGSIFENCDFSCLGAIKLNLTGLIDSIGIDLSDLGIDLSGYDLSDISLSELIEILTNLEIDMSTVTAMLKLFGLELDDLDLKGLISSFDEENFDMSSLLESFNLSDLDFSAIAEIFTNPDIDLASVFENIDYSCLGSIKLNLTGLLDSTGIDLSDFGIDVSDYDLSEISLSELIDALCNSEFIMTALTLVKKSFNIDFENFDMSGLITSFDEENFDMSSLIESLNLADMNIPGIFSNFDENSFDLTEFLNNTLSMFIVQTFPEASQK